jgi:tetratricopeptide (TPR) repeat protein
VLLSVAQPLTAVAQTNAPAPLPPAAQEAFDKGITAAKEGGYVLAIRYLQEARKLAPQAPQIFRSLGAVETKIPGRELRAIAWYGAYLAALANAPDAAEVSKEIVRLEVKSEINISGLIKSVQDAASQVHSGGGYSNPLPSVVVLWAKAGDIAAALKTADSLDDEFEKSYALSATASAQAEAGDISGAQKTADLVARPLHKAGAQVAIGKAQIRARDIAGAQNTFVAALKSADRSEDSNVITGTQTDIAVAQSEIGDIAGAQKNASLIRRDNFKQGAQIAIAKAQIKAGDIAGAQSTLASAQETVDRLEEGDLGKRLAKLDIAEVKAAIADAPNATRQSTAGPQTASQPVVTASNWLGKLDDDGGYNDCPLNTGPFLDLAEYLKSLPPSDDPRSVFESLRQTATKIITAQNIIHQMMQGQARR